MRHNERHNKPPAGATGKWQRHLLAYCRRSELNEPALGAWRPWTPQIIRSIEPLPKSERSAWSSAVAALGTLEDYGLVVVEPQKSAVIGRRKVRRFRLSPRGRKAADACLAPQIELDPKSQKERRAEHPLWPIYLEAHKEVTGLRHGLDEFYDIPFADLVAEIKQLEAALGVRPEDEPDMDAADPIVRAAARNLRQLRAAIDMGMSKTLIDASIDAESYGLQESCQELLGPVTQGSDPSNKS